MTTVLPQLDPLNTYSFGSSTTLGTQIANGAPADILMSANTTEPALLYAEGYVEQPVNYTRNTLAVVVPKSNPANITSIYDLENHGVTIDEAAASVPVGSYTQTVLNNMGISRRSSPMWSVRRPTMRISLRRSPTGRSMPASCTSPTTSSTPVSSP